MGAKYDDLGNYLGYTNDDGTTFSGFGESSLSPTSVRPDLLAAANQTARERMLQLNNDPAYRQFTPEQAQAFLNFHGSADDLSAYSRSISPFEHFGIYNDQSAGGNNLWFGPEAGPQHNDTGPEQTQTAWNDMKNGALIASLPFAWMGVTALAGAGAAGAAEGGAAGAGAAEGGAAGAGAVEGGAGSASLVGDAGADTAGSNGGGMWDLVDNVGFDPGAEGVYNAPIAEDTSTGAFDQFGMNNPNTGFQDQGFDPGGSWLESLKGYGQQGMDVYNKLKAIPGIAALLGNLQGKSAGNKSTGGGILNGVLNDPLGSAFNASPFLLAMAEANRQGNKTDPILARLSGLADQAGSNEGGLLSSVTGPYNRQTMAGRDSLMADQSLRGVRGSSFGDQSLTSYDTTRSQGLGELTGSTQAKSLGLQGGLLNQLLAGQTQAATSRNLLLGAGLNASGKLFQPQSDPFGLKNLLGV